MMPPPRPSREPKVPATMEMRKQTKTNARGVISVRNYIIRRTLAFQGERESRGPVVGPNFRGLNAALTVFFVDDFENGLRLGFRASERFLDIGDLRLTRRTLLIYN